MLGEIIGWIVGDLIVGGIKLIVRGIKRLIK
jgi:hypothetical protein